MKRFTAHENSTYKNYSYRNSAYTLIELLVGITIMALIFSIGLASYRDFSRRQALVGVTKRLVSDLRLIQQKALAGEKIGSCTTLNGYKIIVSSDSYSLYASCATDILLKTVDDLTEKGVTLTSSPTNTITFKILGQGTNLSSDTTISVYSSKLNRTSTVVVGIGGGIE